MLSIVHTAVKLSKSFQRTSPFRAGENVIWNDLRLIFMLIIYKLLTSKGRVKCPSFYLFY